MLSKYSGSYTIELQPGADTDHLPKASVSIKDNIVSVLHGTVHQVMGGIQFYADNHPFTWGYNYIRCIKDANDEVLWKNWDIKD